MTFMYDKRSSDSSVGTWSYLGKPGSYGLRFFGILLFVKLSVFVI